ncbi:MAG: c-type cytochrome domain-containing protein, partial [Bryobacteraceae bacterium]
MNRYFLFFAAAASSLWPLAAAPVDFARDVHPILAARCFACHSGDKRSGGLSLANYQEVLKGGKTGKAISPGSSADSLLMQRVIGDGVPVMPPVGGKLGANDVAVLREWIDQGARERMNSAPARANWVAKMALARPELPAAKEENPI